MLTGSLSWLVGRPCLISSLRSLDAQGPGGVGDEIDVPADGSCQVRDRYKARPQRPISAFRHRTNGQPRCSRSAGSPGYLVEVVDHSLLRGLGQLRSLEYRAYAMRETILEHHSSIVRGCEYHPRIVTWLLLIKEL